MKKVFLLTLAMPLCNQAMEDMGKHLVQDALICGGAAVTACAYSGGAQFLSNLVNTNITSGEDVSWRYCSKNMLVPVNKWGALGSWWMGIPLLMAARIGHHPLEAQELIKPVAITYGATAAIALAAGGYKALTAHVGRSQHEGIEKATAFSRVVGTFVSPVALIGYLIYKRATHH